MNNKSIKILIGLSIFVVFCLSLNLASASYNVATDRGYAVYSDEDKPLYQVVYRTSDSSNINTSNYYYADRDSNNDQCLISSFSSSDTIVNAGDGVRLRWITDDCDYVSITSIGNVANSGSYYVYPQGDTVYRITAYNSNSNKYTKTISIKVQEEEKIVVASASGNTSTVGTNGSDGYVNKPVSTTTKTPVKDTLTFLTNPKISTDSKTATNTSSKNNTNTEDNDGRYGGAVDTTGNGLTALSMGGSGSFMPSSIWQWILVVFLILVVVILFRIVMKTAPKNNHAHA